MKQVKRGDVYYADLGEGIGSEHSGAKLVVVIQNDIGNKFSDTIIIASITSSEKKRKLPTHVCFNECVNGFLKDSIVLCEQIRTIDKKRLKKYLFTLDDEKMKRINNGIIASIDLRNDL